MAFWGHCHTICDIFQPFCLIYQFEYKQTIGCSFFYKTQKYGQMSKCPIYNWFFFIRDQCINQKSIMYCILRFRVDWKRQVCLFDFVLLFCRPLFYRPPLLPTISFYPIITKGSAEHKQISIYPTFLHVCPFPFVPFAERKPKPLFILEACILAWKIWL